MKRPASHPRSRSGLCWIIAAAAGSMAGAPALAGPDVIVGELPLVRHWGASGGITAYSIATTSCNIGDAHLLWIELSDQHPVIAQNMYRLKDGRFEQVGMSWLKHGFCALQQTACGACDPVGTGCEDRLGVGCSDPYSANLNGNQGRLGPRSHVNATTGAFPWPFFDPPDGQGYLEPPTPEATIGRRLQVRTEDIDPALNAGAAYWIEGQYVTADDAAAGNSMNNASSRRISIADSVDGIGADVQFLAPTARQVPAIEAWAEMDPGVVLRTVTVPGEGRFYAAGRATDNGDGTWLYSYAVFNLNSHASAASLSVPVPCGTGTSGVGFSAPRYHSGEVYSNDPWAVTASADTLTWATEPFAANPDANALRWATTYSFWFTAEAPPAEGELTLGLFRTAGETLAITGMPVPGAPACRADWDGAGGVNSNDISAFLTAWLASINGGTLEADFDCGGAVDSNDISAFLTGWLEAVTGGC